MAFPFSHLASVGCSISQTKLAQNAGWSLSSNVAVMWDFAGKESKSAESAFIFKRFSLTFYPLQNLPSNSSPENFSSFS